MLLKTCEPKCFLRVDIGAINVHVFLAGSYLSTELRGHCPSDPPIAYKLIKDQIEFTSVNLVFVFKTNLFTYKPFSTATATPNLRVIMEATLVHLFSLGSYLWINQNRNNNQVLPGVFLKIHFTFRRG